MFVKLVRHKLVESINFSILLKFIRIDTISNKKINILLKINQNDFERQVLTVFHYIQLTEVYHLVFF